MDVSRAVTESVKIYLTTGGLCLVVMWPWLQARWRTALLALLVAVSSANYLRWGPELATRRVDAYDLLHYYVNAKYFEELGYLDLYPCAIVVDLENDGPRYAMGGEYLAQLEGSNAHVLQPIAHAVARGRHVRDARFSPERWEAFEHDVLTLQREVKPGFAAEKGLWHQMINDHGFNGTPVWVVVARPIAARVPVEWVKALGYLDVGLLGLALGAVVWAYGHHAALWTLFWLTVTYSLRWPTVSWAFLRYDYVAALIVATALLRRGWPVGAGLVAGYAAVVRLFPVMWLWGPAAKWLVNRVRGRPRAALVGFALGFGAAVVGLQGLAAADLGAHQIRTHLDNMRDHNDPDEISSRRIGLALALTHDGRTEPKTLTEERRVRIEDQRMTRYAIAGAFLLLMGVSLSKARDDEAFGFGFLPFFLLTTASYYYYASRATLVVIHAGGLDRERDRVGLALLLALEVFSNWAETAFPGHRMFLIGTLAWGLCLYAVVMGAWVGVEAWSSDPGGEGEQRPAPG